MEREKKEKIMTAIRVHHTATDDGSWDGPANEARLKNDGTEAYYRSAHAWIDPEGDPLTKSAYKFIHHFVDGDGKVGAASTRAASAGIAALNGGRGGANIPEGDRKGVWNHLAAHLQDADMEPPDLRSGLEMIEERAFPVELRVSGDDEEPVIEGYAAVFGVWSEDIGGFTEMIRKGAFSKTLKEADVRGLWNHDVNYVLGRTKSGTLSLEEDDKGLKIRNQPPKTTWANDLQVSMKRGDVNQMSFMFQTMRDEWDQSDPKNIKRELIELKLFDVSVVTFPAYPQTAAHVRLLDAISRSRTGEVDPADRELILSAARKLESAPGQGPHPDEEIERQLAHFRKQLELAEQENR